MPSDMTHESMAELIAETRELDSAATKGPWQSRDFDESQAVVLPEPNSGRQPLIATMSIGQGRPDGDDNTRLVVRYRSLAPALADALEQIQRELARRDANLSSYEAMRTAMTPEAAAALAREDAKLNEEEDAWARAEAAEAQLATDAARLRDAERLVWGEGVTWGCDAPDHLAEEVLALRGRLHLYEEALRAVVENRSGWFYIVLDALKPEPSPEPKA